MAFIAFRIFAKLASVAVALWVLLCVALFAIMWLPPGRFCSIIAHVPGPVIFMTMPFQRFWMIARGGSLKAGDVAPDFDLRSHEKTARVRLSAHQGVRPVVRIFGSYT